MSLFKSILLAILSLIIPVLYSLLIRNVPEIPLPSNVFSELIIWAVGLLVGGWSSIKARKIYKARKG